MKNYKAIGKIGEGTFSEVMKMQNLRDGNYYACKQMKQHFEREKTSIIREKDHALYVPIMQIARPHAQQDVLKLGDFGSCRSVYSKQPYTEYISTRWYRAPECLLTDGFYTYKMDLWSAGCVFYEIASLQPLFPGVNELDQISKIHDVIGTPCQKTLTKFKQDQEYLHCQPICPRNASPCCVQWWLTTLMNELRLTKPFSTPISRCKGQLRHRPWPATEKLASPSTPWCQSHPVTTGHSQRSAESRKFDQAKERPFLDLIPERELISVLFQEAAPEARGGPYQKTKASQLDGAAQTEAVWSGQTVLVLQPNAALSAGHWHKRKSPCVEALEVCWCEQEDRHAEGHETSPETVSSTHDQQERGRILTSTPPADPLGEQEQAPKQA
ncbi:MAPK/MAK/MRK overlapping kinase isoform X7 [Psammomys obesus]|uniref:MAPK/MAK/MRK overlapping kinase isoform X7 n=1 Tax=Psammomys obesus TaxID=48139 RepID=UPI0024530D27|nr:MAPK/MAK/MRK overlapping kinase isoform X7 [Psammomys obesus]